MKQLLPLYVLLLYFTHNISAQNSIVGITLVKDINGQGNSNVNNLVVSKEFIFFAANDGVHGSELWKSNGTEEGTSLVKDINVGNVGSSPTNMQYIDDILYFIADDGIHGSELWRSDGTPEGTSLFIDIVEGGGSIPPTSLPFVRSGNFFFFPFDEGTSTKRLWRTDGTKIGTIPISNPQSVMPSSLTDVNGVLFFSINDQTNGASLWKSDGTGFGTVIIKLVGNAARPVVLTKFKNVNGTLFFVRQETVDLISAAFSCSLWKSNGASEGTVSDNRTFQFIDTNLGENIVDGYLFITNTYWINRFNVSPQNLNRTKGILHPSPFGDYFDMQSVEGKNPSNLVTFKNSLYFSSEKKIYKFNDLQGSKIVHSFEKFRDDTYEVSPVRVDTSLYAVVTAGISIDLWKVKNNIVCQVVRQNLGQLKQRVVLGKKIFFAIQSQEYSGVDLFVYNSENDAQAPCRVPQVITSFGPLPGKITDDLPFTISATASSGLPINFSSSNEEVASISGDVVTIKSAGETIITASQQGNDYYLETNHVSQPLVVGSILSTGESADSQTFITRPNPFVHQFFLRVKNSSNSNFSVAVYNSLGRLIEKRDFLLHTIDHSFGDVWLPGIYFIKVMLGNQSFAKTIIKQ